MHPAKENFSRHATGDITRRRFILGGSAAVGALALFGPRGIEAYADENDKHAGSFKRATCVAVTADGATALTSDDNGKLLKYDVAAELRPTEFTRKHTGKAAYVSVVGNRVLTAGYDGDVVIHDLAQTDPIDPPKFQGHRADGQQREVWVAILSADGSQALSAANDGQILLWDPAQPTQAPLKTFNQPQGVPKAPVGGLAFVPPNANSPTHFLSTYSYGEIHLWDVTKPNGPIHVFEQSGSYQVNGLTVSTDGLMFATGGFDGTVRVWDLPNPIPQDKSGFPKKERIRMQPRHKGWVWRVAFNATGKLVASASDDGTVKVWSIAKGQQVDQMDPGKGGAMGVVFVGDTILFTLDGANAAKLIDKKQLKI
jgi:WD40 repeat protein